MSGQVCCKGICQKGLPIQALVRVLVGCCFMGLELRVAHLEELVAQLASEVRELRLARASSQPASSEASFSLVPDSQQAAPPASPSRRRFSPLARAGSSGQASPSAGPGSHSTPLQPPSASERAAACREIGLFLRRCLSGEHRDWLATASRYRFVLRDFGPGS